MITRNLETSVSIGLDPGLVFADGVVEKHFVDSVPLGELSHHCFMSPLKLPKHHVQEKRYAGASA